VKAHPHRGLLLTVGAIGLILLVGGIVQWQPLASALTERFPTALAFVITGAWFLTCALTSIPKPYNGLWLVAGSIVALPLILGFVGAAAGAESYRPIGFALAVFTASGALLMNAARKERGRPWLAVAWPGIVIVVASTVMIAVTITRPGLRTSAFRVPGTMLPAERGP
jgi:hypothetical protein